MKQKINIEAKNEPRESNELPKLIGELKVDVYETEKEIVVRSTIAGVSPKDLDISLHNDLLTIRGKRHIKEEVGEDSFLVRECFWGDFSRSIILPTSVDVKKSEATFKDGVLIIRLPKVSSKTSIPVRSL
jgi:HSP20 family protein